MIAADSVGAFWAAPGYRIVGNFPALSLEGVGATGPIFEMDGYADQPEIYFTYSGGTSSAPTALPTTTVIGDMGFYGNNGGGGFGVGAQIAARSEELFTSTNHATSLRFRTDILAHTGLADRVVIDGSGNTNIENGFLIIPTHTPGSAADTGVTGTITWDSGFIYICVATNSWKRVAIAAW